MKSPGPPPPPPPEDPPDENDHHNPYDLPPPPPQQPTKKPTTAAAAHHNDKSRYYALPVSSTTSAHARAAARDGKGNRHDGGGYIKNKNKSGISNNIIGGFSRYDEEGLPGPDVLTERKWRRDYMEEEMKGQVGEDESEEEEEQGIIVERKREKEKGGGGGGGGKWSFKKAAKEALCRSLRWIKKKKKKESEKESESAAAVVAAEKEKGKDKSDSGGADGSGVEEKGKEDIVVVVVKKEEIRLPSKPVPPEVHPAFRTTTTTTSGGLTTVRREDDGAKHHPIADSYHHTAPMATSANKPPPGIEIPERLSSSKWKQPKSSLKTSSGTAAAASFKSLDSKGSWNPFNLPGPPRQNLMGEMMEILVGVGGSVNRVKGIRGVGSNGSLGPIRQGQIGGLLKEKDSGLGGLTPDVVGRRRNQQQQQPQQSRSGGTGSGGGGGVLSVADVPRIMRRQRTYSSIYSDDYDIGPPPVAGNTGRGGTRSSYSSGATGFMTKTSSGGLSAMTNWTTPAGSIIGGGAAQKKRSGDSMSAAGGAAAWWNGNGSGSDISAVWKGKVVDEGSSSLRGAGITTSAITTESGNL